MTYTHIKVEQKKKVRKWLKKKYFDQLSGALEALKAGWSKYTTNIPFVWISISQTGFVFSSVKNSQNAPRIILKLC